MSTVDLSKCIARKKFFISAKSSDLNQLILEQLKLDDPSWYTSVKRSRSGTFELYWGNRWAQMSLQDEGLPLTKSNLAKKLAEYKKNVIEHIDEILERTVESIPWYVHFVVTEERTAGCVCEITCFPTLYFQICRDLDVKCDEANFQHVRLQCEEFLADVIVGGLGGKEIVGKKEVSRWELLINDVDCRDITDRIYQMLEQATGEVLVIGWVGTDCLPKLKELKSQGVTIQAVTHKPKEMKSPVPKDIQQGYTNLIKMLGKTNVSTNRELHGRAIIVDNKALIGSMDLNSYSLSGEHMEFAIYTEDVDVVREMRTYFKKIFVPLKRDE